MKLPLFISIGFILGILISLMIYLMFNSGNHGEDELALFISLGVGSGLTISSLLWFFLNKKIRTINPGSISYFTLIFDLLSLGCLLFFVGFSCFKVANLPQQIPVHFNTAGEIDRYGSKYVACGLPGLACFIYVLLSYVNRSPESFNYPFAITEATASRHYKLAMNFIRWIRLTIVLTFSAIFLNMIHAAENGSAIFGIFLLPIILLLVFLPILFYLFLAYRIRNSEK